MGLFSSSKSSTSVSTTTTNIADSYNETFNKVDNLSNSKNVSIVLGAAGKDAPNPNTLLPVAAVLGLGALAWFTFKR